MYKHETKQTFSKRAMLALVSLSVLFVLLVCLNLLINLAQDDLSKTSLMKHQGTEDIVYE